VIEALFFDEAITGVVGEAIGGAVLVDQLHQAQGVVVAVAHEPALGILADLRQAAGGTGEADALAVAVEVFEQLAMGVVGETFAGTMQFAFLGSVRKIRASKIVVMAGSRAAWQSVTNSRMKHGS